MPNTKHVAVLAAMLAACAASPGNSQQTVTPTTAQVISSNQLPPGYTVAGMSGAYQIVQTTDPSILQNVSHHWVYKYNGMLGSTYVEPVPHFDVTTGGEMQLQSPRPASNSQGTGLDASTAGQLALNDGYDSGCAIALCIAAPAYVPECQPALDRLAQLIRHGGSAPSCKGTSVDYVPYSCSAPWTLVKTGEWKEFACQALLQPQQTCAEENARAYAEQIAQMTFSGASTENGMSVNPGRTSQVLAGDDQTYGPDGQLYSLPNWYVVEDVTRTIIEFRTDCTQSARFGGYGSSGAYGWQSTNGETSGTTGDSTW